MFPQFPRSMAGEMRQSLLASAALLALSPSVSLAQEAPQDRSEQFTLGTIVVVAPRSQVGEVGDEQVSSLVTRKDMRQFNRDNIGDALNLLSGVTLSTNSRNEKTIAVRGFDSRQVPLFIDGIPVYVPYDGYVDFNRFTTADLAAIQVAKGFSSVAYGANTLGGAINLISRKPSQKFEGDVSAGVAAGDARQASVNLGTNQGLWYAQVGAGYVESVGFPLSSDFQPTSTEDGGRRNNDYRRDIKLSFKVGLTPNASDEYAISHYIQNGQKGQPPSTDPAAARYWQWPYWNKESLYFVSKTALGANELVKLRLYNDRYDNEVDSYTNVSYSTLKTSGKGSVSTGRSIYNDRTNGASFELESARFTAQTLRLVGQYKTDDHKESDALAAVNAIFKDELVSWGVEDNIQLDPRLALSLGAARHQLRPQSVFSLGSAYSLPEAQSATDVQAGLFHEWSSTTRLYATVARKSRLPTLKDRYSQRLGTYIENPELRQEEAFNYELGYKGTPWTGQQIEAALFYSDISNMIQSVANVSGTKSQMQNVGKVRAAGLELGWRGQISSSFEVGGNYTLTDRDNVSDSNTKLTDVPRHKLTAHALARPVASVDVIAYAEYNSHRWASNTVDLAGFTTLNLKTVARPVKGVSLEAGVTNLTDRNYALADGFPSPGRMWFINGSYQF